MFFTGETPPEVDLHVITDSVVITDDSTLTSNVIRYKRSDGTEGQVVGPIDLKLTALKEHFAGVLDEVAVWERALTAEEIAGLAGRVQPVGVQ